MATLVHKRTMSIRPVMRGRHTVDWDGISRRVRLGRAQGRCEWGGAVHGEAHLDHQTDEQCGGELGGAEPEVP